MKVVGIVSETYPNEKRAAGTPDTVARFIKMGYRVVVERGAGLRAGYADAQYEQQGARVVTREQCFAEADILTRVRALNDDEIALLKPGQTVVSFFWPAQNPALVEKMRQAQVTQLAMDCVPRITRAQKMDALSSMANIAGYRAVIEAANVLPRLFSGQITAAGKIAPAKVLIIGAGVAGLSAVGAARGLGAIVRAFDTRPVVREQVQSMGAEFLEVTGVHEDGTGQGGYAKEMSKAFIEAEMALFAAQALDVDIIITTALIPGKPAPKLITKEMVESMRAGSVIVDLAAEQGGNCELTKPGEITVHQGVSIIGYVDLPSRMAAQATQLYGTNIAHLLDDMSKSKVANAPREFRVDFDDEVVRGACITRDGTVTWPPPKVEPSPRVDAKPAPQVNDGSPIDDKPKAALAPLPVAAKKHEPAHKPSHSSHGHAVGAPSNAILIATTIVLVAIGHVAPAAFLSHLIVFVLACFIGFQVIWNVSPALHTPLMSVTNAISGIILIGGLLHANDSFARFPTSTVLGAVAVLVASINIAGGFLVTQRMLKMFRRGDEKNDSRAPGSTK